MNSFAINLIWQSLPLFLKGVLVTAKLFVVASMLSLLVGFVLGVFSSKRIQKPIFVQMINSITFISRAVPFFVQLLIVYFVFPEILPINFTPFAASVIALGFCSSGYVAQFIRGAIDSIDPAQWEVAQTLGYSQWQIVMRIIFPQALRIALPSLNNELESLLKSTAIASSIGMLELTRIGMNIVSREMEPAAVYLAIALFYIALSIVLKKISQQLERRFCNVVY